MKNVSRRNAMQIAIGLVGGVAFGSGAALANDNPMPEELRRALEREPNSPVLGNGTGDITFTEFFDYNCPFCRASVPDVHRLISEDKKLRVVFREWPVFGEGSLVATKVSLATLKQGKYWKFHSALMSIKGKADEKSAMAVARQIGVDVDKLRHDMESAAVLEQIDQTMRLADHIGLMGTPTYIAGNSVLFGKQSFSDLRGLIARGRKALL